MSSGDEYSAGLCEIPPLHRMKIIDVGILVAVYTLIVCKSVRHDFSPPLTSHAQPRFGVPCTQTRFLRRIHERIAPLFH